MDIVATNRGNGRKNGGVHNVNAGSNQRKPQESQTGLPPVNKDQCHRCKGFGHWRNECPNNRRRAPRGGGSVNHVGSGPAEEEEDEDDSDDSEDWVGCATLSSGNSKGQA